MEKKKNKDMEEELKEQEEATEETQQTAHETENEQANQGEKNAEDKASEEKPLEDSKQEAQTEEDEQLNTKYLRLMADFQNFKRRTEKEKSDIYAYANEKIVSELLNVIDNFERALEHSNEEDSFAEGMKLIFKQLQGVLEKVGVVEIKALGEDFDPNYHNAVMTEATDEYESGKVTQVLQKGYLLNNKVVRPSMVKVAE